MTAAQPKHVQQSVASLWAHTGVDAPRLRPLERDTHCDTVIVGAGYTGLSAAHSLATRGVSAVVIDANAVGWGASGRNGGVVSPKFRVAFPAIAAAYGLDTARRMNSIAHQAVDAVAELVSEHGITDANFKITGFLRCAHNDRALAHMLTEAEWLRASLNDTSMATLSADEVQVETGSHGFVGGLLHKDAGTIHPLNYIRGLARALDAKGVPIYEDTPALRFGRESSGIIVETPHGIVHAKQLIIATNAYSSITRATAKLKRSVIPFRSAIIATQKLPRSLDGQLLVNERSYGETRRMMRWFRKVDQRLLFGGRGAFGKEDTDAAFDALRRAMVKLFPDLDTIPLEFKWSGHVAMTLNCLPHVGRLDERTSFAIGYNGAGVAMASLLGGYAARFSMGESPDVAVLDARHLKPVPLYPLRELGVRLTAGWYQFLDAIGA
jgi:glycine/D-amino acid oxidase-like deaminating enzyme